MIPYYLRERDGGVSTKILRNYTTVRDTRNVSNSMFYKVLESSSVSPRYTNSVQNQQKQNETKIPFTLL